MGRRAVAMQDRLEFWPHGQAGHSLRALERNLEVDRHTLRKYIGIASAAGYPPGQPGVTVADWLTLYWQAFPHLTSAQPAQTLLAPYHDRLAWGFVTNTVTTVWRRIVRDTGCPVSLRTFRRYDATLAQAPGQEVRVDYGLKGH